MVERVEGFVREKEWLWVYWEINELEVELIVEGYVVVKFFFYISFEE